MTAFFLVLFWQGGNFHVPTSSCAARKTKGGGCEQWSSLKGRGAEQRLLVLIKNRPLAKFEGVSSAWGRARPAGNGSRGATGTRAAGCPQHCQDLLPHAQALPHAWVLPHALALPSPLPLLPPTLFPLPRGPPEPLLCHPLVTPLIAHGEPSPCPALLRCPCPQSRAPQGTTRSQPPAMVPSPLPWALSPHCDPPPSAMGLFPPV